MKKFYLIILIALILTLNSCVSSLNPIYTEKDLIFIPELVGEWTETDNKSKTTWTFKKQDEKKYILNFLEDDKLATFKGNVTKIGDYYYLDLYLKETDTINSLYNLHIFPVHTFSRLTINGDKLNIEFFSWDWFKEKFKEGKKQLDYIESEDKQIMITSRTLDLREFMLKNVTTKEPVQGNDYITELKRKK